MANGSHASGRRRRFAAPTRLASTSGPAPSPDEIKKPGVPRATPADPPSLDLGAINVHDLFYGSRDPRRGSFAGLARRGAVRSRPRGRSKLAIEPGMHLSTGIGFGNARVHARPRVPVVVARKSFALPALWQQAHDRDVRTAGTAGIIALMLGGRLNGPLAVVASSAMRGDPQASGVKQVRRGGQQDNTEPQSPPLIRFPFPRRPSAIPAALGRRRR